MHQDATWYGGRPQPRRLCVRWGSSTLLNKGAAPPNGPYLLRPNGWMHQDATWYGGKPRPRRRCVIYGVAAPPKRGTAAQFSVHVYCGQTAAWMKTPHGTEVDLGPGDIVLDGDPTPPRKGYSSSPVFSAHVNCGHGRPSQLLLSSCSLTARCRKPFHCPY